MIIETRAYARAALLGNPSDGYNGKTISISVKNFGAQVSLYETPDLCIEPQVQDINIFKNIYELVESVNLVGYYGGDRLIKAAIKQFFEYCAAENIKLSNRNFTVRYHSSIPRQLGLAGSSAIVTATMRALIRFYEIEVPQPVLPNLVLAAEKSELGIGAGLQDRVIQCYEGCVYMDFDKEYMKKHGHGIYEPIDPHLLPRLFIAYRPALGKVSGVVHNDLRARYDSGEKLVHDTMKEVAACAEEGRKAISKKDFAALHELMNRNSDLRRKMIQMSPANLELIDTARHCGACANFTGSGGSIIGICEDEEVLTHVIVDMRKIGARVIRPYVI